MKGASSSTNWRLIAGVSVLVFSFALPFVFLMGGEFWGKFRSLFIWEGKV